MATAVPIFQYPEKLSDVQFKNRKFTIYVKDPIIQHRAADAVKYLGNVLSSSTGSSGSTLTNTNNSKPDLTVVHTSSASEIARVKRNNANANIDSTKAVIVLPVPNSLDDSQTHDWELTGGITAQVAGAVLNKGVNNTADNIGKRAGGLKKGLNGMASQIGSLTGSLNAGALTAQLANAAGVSKPVVNPRYFQNYNGTKPRTFNASWDLIPESKIEADRIFEIVMKLKEFSSPRLALGGNTLIAPMYFSVELNNDYLTSMLSLDKVVITTVDLKYSSDDSMQLTRDGMPKSMRLTISFNEWNVQTAEDYNTEPMRQ